MVMLLIIYVQTHYLQLFLLTHHLLKKQSIFFCQGIEKRDVSQTPLRIPVKPERASDFGEE